VEYRSKTSQIAAWTTSIGFALCGIALFNLCGLRMDMEIAMSTAGFTLFGCTLGLFTFLRNPNFTLASACGGIMQLLLCGCATIWLECVAAKSGAPFIDRWAMGFDTALGYDWLAYASFIASSPLLAGLLGWAYLSLLYQSAATVFLIGLFDTARMSQFLIANTLILSITIAIFALAPETSPWIHAKAPLALRAHLGLPVDDWLDTLLALRSGDLPYLRGGLNMALIGFPSYHSSGALLILWAVWPMRWLRYSLLPLNIALIASTPFYGGHYIADIVVAPFIVALGVLGAGRIIDLAARPAPLRSRLRVAARALG